jgi:hypothetical protein
VEGAWLEVSAWVGGCDVSYGNCFSFFEARGQCDDFLFYRKNWRFSLKLLLYVQAEKIDHDIDFYENAIFCHKFAKIAKIPNAPNIDPRSRNDQACRILIVRDNLSEWSTLQACFIKFYQLNFVGYCLKFMFS